MVGISQVITTLFMMVEKGEVQMIMEHMYRELLELKVMDRELLG